MFGTTNSHRTAPSEQAWTGLGEYLHRATTRLLSNQRRSELLTEWSSINEQEAALDDAILIGLAGGTGVGKSTFINALAGAPISRSSDRRPTTSRVVVYRNIATELPSDLPTEHFAQPQVLHEKPSLTKVILFDFPDFDSAESSHAAILEEYLPHLDIVFIVVDDVKYGDRRLYELLSQLTHDQTNMFVLLNKVDRLDTRYGDKATQVIEEIRRDLREKLEQYANIRLGKDQQFAIASKSVFDARSAGKTSPYYNSFERVERLLESFQIEKHRRVVKERNLDARKQAVIEIIQQEALGAQNRAIIDESLKLVAKWRSETEHAAAAIPVEILSERERRSLRQRRLRRVSARWGFPTSALITLMSEIRRWRGTDDSAHPGHTAVRIHQHYRAFFESLANLKARIESEVAGTALAGEPLLQPTGTTALVSPAPESSEALTGRLGVDFDAQIATREHQPKRIRRLFCHLPAALVVGLAVWSRVYGVIDPTDDRGFFKALLSEIWATISPSFLIGIALSVLLAYLMSAIFVWIREIQILEGEIADGEQKVREEIRKHGNQVIGAIDGRVQSLHDEFEQLGKVVGKPDR